MTSIRHSKGTNHVLAAITVLVMLTFLSACSSTESTLDIEGKQTDTAQAAADAKFPTLPGNNATADTATPQPAKPAAGTAGSVRFAPIVGAPVEKVTALSRRLSAAASASKVKLEPASSSAADHEIRGYFSALSEGGTITVIHVWDVFTLTGQRVHRYQGEEKFAGTAADAWSAVPAPVMETIADKVLADYAAWRRQSAA